MPVLNIAIVARLPFVRAELRACLENERAFQVTSLAPTDELVEELFAADAQILLLDIQVLENEGWQLLEELRALPHLRTLVIGDRPDDRRVVNALALGARGFLLRARAAAEIPNAIHAARSGSIVLDAQVAATLTRALRAHENSRAENETDAEVLIEPLTERESQTLRLMTRGLANKQIASELFITEHTVKFHIRAILGKLGAANRTEAATLALQKGLVNL